MQPLLVHLVGCGAAVLHQLKQLTVSFQIEVAEFSILFFHVHRIGMDFVLELADGEWVFRRRHCCGRGESRSDGELDGRR